MSLQSINSDMNKEVIEQYKRFFSPLTRRPFDKDREEIKATIKYKVSGFCSYSHKKHKKIALCEINGQKYCFNCGCNLLTEYSISRKTLKWAKREKFQRKKKGKKKQKGKKTEAEWKKRVFASWQDTPEQAAFRRSPEYQEWRVIVLERDKYICQHCEQTGGRLVVHHVKTFKMNPELRLEPDNGIVLCNNCHEKLHLSRVKKPRILKLA